MLDKQSLIEQLCRAHTNLNSEEIAVISNAAANLEQIAANELADVFIDCLCRNGQEAIVVSQATYAHSLYEFSTVGYRIQEIDEPAVFRSLRYGVRTEGVKAITCASTRGNIVVQNITPLFYNGQTIGVLIIERENLPDQTKEIPSKSHVAPEYLIAKESDPDYLFNIHWIGECLEEGLIVVDHRGFVNYRNAAAQKIYEDYGYVLDILGKEYEFISLHGRLDVLEGKPSYSHIELALRGQYYVFRQFRVLAEQQFYVIVISNRTKEKQYADMQLTQSSAVREIHHRIKNGLHIIYSLLDMQKRRLDDKTARDILQDAMNRIISIATTYETLLLREKDEIDLLQLIEAIAAYFRELITKAGPNVSISVKGVSTTVPRKLAESISLVINELIQNAYNHAFYGKTQGKIVITIESSRLYTSVTVADNGIGYDMRSEKGGTKFGMQIVNMIVTSKLKGKLHIEATENEGTKVAFTFRNQEQNTKGREGLL